MRRDRYYLMFALSIWSNFRLPIHLNVALPHLAAHAHFAENGAGA